MTAACMRLAKHHGSAPPKILAGLVHPGMASNTDVHAAGDIDVLVEPIVAPSPGAIVAPDITEVPLTRLVDAVMDRGDAFRTDDVMDRAIVGTKGNLIQLTVMWICQT